MTGYGFCFRPAPLRQDCSGTLLLWVADYRGKTDFITTTYDVSYEEWDPVVGCLVLTGSDIERRRELLVYARKMVEDLRRIEEIVRSLEQCGRYTADDVVRCYTLSLAPAPLR